MADIIRPDGEVAVRHAERGDGTHAEVVIAADEPLASIDDTTSTAGYYYFCEARPGTLTSAASWRISRLNTTTGQLQWADGNANFDNVADNRTSLTYS